MPPFSFSFPFHQNPNKQNPSPPNPLQSNLSSFLSGVQSSSYELLKQFCPVGPIPTSPLWARIASSSGVALAASSDRINTVSMSERLDGVPVYALSNKDDEFVLVSGSRTGKSLGLFCFKKEDAEAILQEMKGMSANMRGIGSRVVPVALNKVFELKIDGIAFRFVPDASQVSKAIKVMEKSGAITGGSFPGVPIFQSKSLFVRSGNKRYRPVFFRKEDLDNSLAKASRLDKRIKSDFKIEVTVLEEMIKEMSEGSSNEFDDVVFVPPGFQMSIGQTDK